MYFKFFSRTITQLNKPFQSLNKKFYINFKQYFSYTSIKNQVPLKYKKDIVLSSLVLIIPYSSIASNYTYTKLNCDNKILNSDDINKQASVPLIVEKPIHGVLRLVSCLSDEYNKQCEEERINKIKQDYKLYYKKYKELYERIKFSNSIDFNINYDYANEIKYHLLLIAIKENDKETINKINKIEQGYFAHRNCISIAISENNIEFIEYMRKL